MEQDCVTYICSFYISQTNKLHCITGGKAKCKFEWLRRMNAVPLIALVANACLSCQKVLFKERAAVCDCGIPWTFLFFLFIELISKLGTVVPGQLFCWRYLRLKMAATMFRCSVAL